MPTSPDSPTLTADDMVAHGAWLRALARSLLTDRAAADDMVHETWVAALRSPPERDRPLRPWLAEVLRNFVFMRARHEGARAHREATAGGELHSSTAPASAEDLLIKHEMLRSLAELVSGLKEHYKSTVLLCYVEGLSSDEAGRRLGVSAGTVRWRLKQALDELRSRLDAAHAGGRRAWRMALLPFVAPARDLGSFWKGALVMNAKPIVLTAALLSVAAAGAVQLRKAAAPKAAEQEMAVEPPRDSLLDGRSPPSANASRDERAAREALARYQAQISDLQQIAAKSQEQEQELASLRAEVAAARRKEMKGRFVGVDKEELLDRAKRCQVRWDAPPSEWGDKEERSKRGEQQWGLVPAELEVFSRILREVNAHYESELRGLFARIKEDTEAARTMTLAQMEADLHKVVNGRGGLWKKLAEERAGLAPPPSDLAALSPEERFARLVSERGDDFEKRLAAELGPMRAHELRAKNDGWWSKWGRGGCPKSP